jgi:hypothetical protein
MFEKQRNERQAQARFVTLGKGGDQKGWATAQGTSRVFSAPNKIHTQGVKGVCKLIACGRNCGSHG